MSPASNYHGRLLRASSRCSSLSGLGNGSVYKMIPTFLGAAALLDSVKPNAATGHAISGVVIGFVAAFGALRRGRNQYGAA